MVQRHLVLIDWNIFIDWCLVPSGALSNTEVIWLRRDVKGNGSRHNIPEFIRRDTGKLRKA